MTEEFCDFPGDVQDAVRKARKARACIVTARDLHDKMVAMRNTLYAAVGSGVAYDAASKAIGDVQVQISELQKEQKAATDRAVAKINYHRALVVIFPNPMVDDTDG